MSGLTTSISDIALYNLQLRSRYQAPSKVNKLYSHHDNRLAVLHCLVEFSSTCPGEREGFKNKLKDNETFETDFIGASEEDCQKWVREKSFQVNFIEHDIIAIGYARSARDDSLLIQRYAPELDPYKLRQYNFDFIGREYTTWYNFRVDYKEAAEVHVNLQYVDIDIVFPIYFGRKEELTDKSGVFDFAKADRLLSDL